MLPPLREQRHRASRAAIHTGATIAQFSFTPLRIRAELLLPVSFGNLRCRFFLPAKVQQRLYSAWSTMTRRMTVRDDKRASNHHLRFVPLVTPDGRNKMAGRGKPAPRRTRQARYRSA